MATSAGTPLGPSTGGPSNDLPPGDVSSIAGASDPAPGNPHSAPPPVSDQKLVAGICYGLYALSLFGLVLPSIAAIVINYLKRDMSTPLYRAHHHWMIRTFWWGLLWSLIGGVLSLAVVGWAVLFVIWVWWIYRLIRGFLALMENLAPQPSR